MAEELDTLVLKIRTDTAALAHDAAEMKALFAASAEGIAGSMSEALAKLITQGKLGFQDWKKLLQEVLTEIAKIGTEMIFGTPSGQNSGGSGWAGVLAQAATLFSTSGRATGGPVTQGRAYMVGERGPEIFVPERAGRIETLNGGAGGGRPINISINVAAPDTASPQLMQRSARQVARAVRRAVADV